MTRPGMLGERTLALFFLGLLLFNPPVLSLFSVDRLFAGMPLLYLYLFVVWGVFIALVGLTAARLNGASTPPPRPAGKSGKA